jgi:membrane-bound serine protease (ClpP class)
MKRALFSLCLFLVGLFATTAAKAGTVYVIHLDQPIQPITQEYIVHAIKKANEKNADLILIDMDTPGGFIVSVEKIQKAILASKAPVVTYVTPSGARAASGGAFIALTCDLIAMAPGTNIGAAHPVSGIPLPVPSPQPVSPPEGGDKGLKPRQNPPNSGVEMEKIVNDLAAHMRSLAANRHRNVELAEKMVRESVSFTEQEALKSNLIELIAKNRQAIFDYINTHPIRRFDGNEQKVDLGPSPQIIEIDMSVRERFLSALANPSLAYILLLLGALGLFVEFKSPGLIFPGVLGGIFILLYLMSIPLLPVNVVGLLLIFLGIAFFILELKVVSYGMLSIGGVIALLVGSMMLYSQGPIPELRLPLTIILPVVAAFSAIVVFLLTLVAKAMRNPVVTGSEGIVGQEGTVRQAVNPPLAGKVFVFGEYWNAVSDTPLAPGDRVKVVGQDGMTLRVVPQSEGGNHGEH